MIRDYSEYNLEGKERLVFYAAGYICIFIACYLFYHSLILGLVCGMMVKFMRPYAQKKLADRRRGQLNMQFKDLLYSLSASIAAGRQMSEALVEAYDNLSVLYSESDLIMVELKHMRVNMLENKESDKVLLQDFAIRSGSEDISNFVQVYVTCRNMGGDLEKIIGHSCQVLTDKMNIEKEIRVITNQKQMEGRIISMMPFMMLLVMNITSNSYIAPLYETIMGRIIMTGSLIAIAAGMYLMEKISAIEV